jgi:hypothetical protein
MAALRPIVESVERIRIDVHRLHAQRSHRTHRELIQKGTLSPEVPAMIDRPERVPGLDIFRSLLRPFPN